ncbi:MAG: FHA domain-containing protein [Saccharofermentanales bacterium]|jgi:hypothetical protein
MQLNKTDTRAVWMLAAPNRTPYPSIDTLADTAFLRHRPHAVSPVSWFRADRTSWKFTVPQRGRLPLAEAVHTMPTDAITGFRVLCKTMEAIETASDHLLPIIPVLLHPELIFVERYAEEQADLTIQIVSLPLNNPEHMRCDQEPTLIEWMGAIFHWDASSISQLSELFRKEASFDLLLESKSLCGETYDHAQEVEYSTVSAHRQLEHARPPSAADHARIMNERGGTTADQSSIGERVMAKLKKFGDALFGYQNHETIHEVTQELDLTSDRFKIAQLSEGLPGTPEEELGHHAYILTEEFAIGRDMGKADFWIDSYSVSRRHAVIRRRSGSYFIEDLGSKNGTTLDGIKLPKHREHLLPDKCKISFADHVYYFRSA